MVKSAISHPYFWRWVFVLAVAFTGVVFLLTQGVTSIGCPTIDKQAKEAGKSAWDYTVYNERAWYGVCKG